MTMNTVQCSAGSGGQVAGGCGCNDSITFRGYKFKRDPRTGMLLDSQYVGPLASATVAALGQTDLITIELARDEWMFFHSYGFDILDSPAGTAITGFSNVTWNLLVNDIPVPTFGRLQDQIGRASDPAPIHVLVAEPGATVKMRVVNAHATDSFLCFVRLIGYTIPLRERA